MAGVWRILASRRQGAKDVLGQTFSENFGKLYIYEANLNVSFSVLAIIMPRVCLLGPLLLIRSFD